MKLSIDIAQRVEQCIEYNVVGGKMIRALGVVTACQYGSVTGSSGDEHIRKACILAWCIELLQACFLIADDVMDQSEKRRGKPCWYKVVGLAAINDALILESLVFAVLKKEFFEDRNSASKAGDYHELVELFRIITFRTELGQLLDLTSFNPNSPSLEKFTSERYFKTIEMKTAYYSFVLPIHACLIFLGLQNPKRMEATRKYLLKLGTLFQVQDDYLDLYGDPKVTGKIGTDIEEGKCTWIALKFLELASEEDKDLFKSSIGNSDLSEAVAGLYRKYSLDDHYHKYAAKLEAELNESLQDIEEGALREMCRTMSDLIFGRQR